MCRLCHAYDRENAVSTVDNEVWDGTAVWRRASALRALARIYREDHGLGVPTEG